MKNTYIALWTGIMIILIVYITPYYSIKEFVSRPSVHRIPAIIWTYWNNDTIPDIVKRCIDSWAYHNPEYKINVVTPSNLYDYIDINIKKYHSMIVRHENQILCVSSF